MCGVVSDDIWPQYEREGEEEPEWLVNEKEHFTEHRSAATVAGDPLPSISPPLTGIEMVMADSAKRN